VASRRMCHLLDFERLGRSLTGDSLLPFQLFWEQIRLRQFRRALSYERKDQPELRPDVVPLPRRHSLILGRRVTFTFAVAKFSEARLRRVTPAENFPLRLRLSTLTGSSTVGARCGTRVSDSNEEKTYCGDIYHVPVTIAGRDAWRPLEKVTDGRPIYFPATDGPNVRICSY